MGQDFASSGPGGVLDYDLNHVAVWWLKRKGIQAGLSSGIVDREFILDSVWDSI